MQQMGESSAQNDVSTNTSTKNLSVLLAHPIQNFLSNSSDLLCAMCTNITRAYYVEMYSLYSSFLVPFSSLNDGVSELNQQPQ